MTMAMTKCLCIKCFSRIHISWIWRWGISTLQVAIPETPKWSLSELTPSLLVTTGGDHRLCQKALHISQVYKLHRVWSMIEISIDPMVQILSRSRIPYHAPLTPSQRLVLWFDGLDLILIQWLRSYRDFDDLLVMFLASPSHDSRNSEMESDQWSRSHLDLMDAIKSWFRISRFRWLCFLPLQVAIGETLKWSLDQWSRSHLDLTVAIKSWFHISWFQWLCFLPLQVLIGETLQWSSDQRSKINLELMAKIVLRFRISRIQEVREPRSFEFPVSDMMFFRHVSYLKMDR